MYRSNRELRLHKVKTILSFTIDEKKIKKLKVIEFLEIKLTNSVCRLN